MKIVDCFIFCFIFALSWSLIAAQSCQYTVNTTDQLFNVIVSVCSDPSISNVEICLQEGSSFTGELDTSQAPCKSPKQFTISGPESFKISFTLDLIIWTVGPLTLQRLALDVSRSSPFGGTFATISLSTTLPQVPPLQLLNVSIVGSTQHFADYSLFGLQGGTLANSTIVISGLSIADKSLKFVFLDILPVELHFVIDGLQLTDTLLAGFIDAQSFSFASATMVLRNSVISGVQLQGTAIFAFNQPNGSSVVSTIDGCVFQGNSLPEGRILYVNSPDTINSGDAIVTLSNSKVTDSMVNYYAGGYIRTYGLFSVGLIPDGQLVAHDNVFLDNLSNLNLTLNVSAVIFSGFNTSTAQLSGNQISPPIVCLPGSATVAPASLLCQPCTPGTASALGVSCNDCTPGLFTSQHGAINCIGCSPGYTSSPAAKSCTKCQPGYYSDSSGSPKCYACPANSYQPQSGQSSCPMCPPDQCSPPASDSCKNCPSEDY